MPDVVDRQKNSDDQKGSRAEPERTECDERAKRQPARPYQSIANTPKRSAKSGAKALDHRCGNAVELRPRESTNGDSREIRMSVEILRVPAERFGVFRSIEPTGKQSERGLGAER